jgi:hypothetical protein
MHLRRFGSDICNCLMQLNPKTGKPSKMGTCHGQSSATAMSIRRRPSMRSGKSISQQLLGLAHDIIATVSFFL